MLTEDTLTKDNQQANSTGLSSRIQPVAISIAPRIRISAPPNAPDRERSRPPRLCSTQTRGTVSGRGHEPWPDAVSPAVFPEVRAAATGRQVTDIYLLGLGSPKQREPRDIRPRMTDSGWRRCHLPPSPRSLSYRDPPEICESYAPYPSGN